MPISGIQYLVVEWDGSFHIITVTSVSLAGEMTIRYADGVCQTIPIPYFKQALAPLAVN
jgi:hypothetical protein